MSVTQSAALSHTHQQPSKQGDKNTLCLFKPPGSPLTHWKLTGRNETWGCTPLRSSLDNQREGRLVCLLWIVALRMVWITHGISGMASSFLFIASLLHYCPDERRSDLIKILIFFNYYCMPTAISKQQRVLLPLVLPLRLHTGCPILLVEVDGPEGKTFTLLPLVLKETKSGNLNLCDYLKFTVIWLLQLIFVSTYAKMEHKSKLR